MSIVKKVSAIVVSASMLFVSSMNVAAIDTSDETISFETYYSTIQAEYAKYGIQYEILEVNPTYVPNTTDLAYALDLARTVGESQDSAGRVEVKLKASNIEDTLSPQAMIEAPFEYEYSWEIYRLPYGFVSFRTVCEGSVDLNRGEVISVDDFYTRDITYANFDSVTFDVEDYTTTNGNKSISWELEGYVRFVWQEPNSGYTTSITADFEESDTFVVADYT